MRTVDPGLGEAVGDEFPGERLHARQHAGAAHQQGDLAAQRPPGGGHLDGDHAAADDREPARHPPGGGGLTAGPRPRVRQPRQVGQGRAGAGADGHRVACGEHPPTAVRVRDGDPADAVEPGVAAHQVDPGGREPVDLAVVLPVRGEVVAPGQHRRGVQRSGDRLAGARQPARLRERDGRPQQRLAGHAGPVRALAADQFALHQRHGQTGRPGPVREVLPGGAAAEHEDVVLRLVVVRPLARCRCHPSASRVRWCDDHPPSAGGRARRPGRLAGTNPGDRGKWGRRDDVPGTRPPAAATTRERTWAS